LMSSSANWPPGICDTKTKQTLKQLRWRKLMFVGVWEDSAIPGNTLSSNLISS